MRQTRFSSSITLMLLNSFLKAAVFGHIGSPMMFLNKSEQDSELCAEQSSAPSGNKTKQNKTICQQM